MPSIINSDDGVVSGTSGLKTTGGNDGILSIQNNGTTNVTVTAAGNVGIGTTSPLAKLHTAQLNNSGNVFAFLQNTGGASNTGQGVQLSFGNDTGSTPGLPNGYVRTLNTGGANSAAAMAFGTFTGSAIQEQMRISSAGQVTKPYQPAFYARFASDSFNYGAGNTIWDQAVLNVGGHYNTSNGRFTAPVAGVYVFVLQVQHFGGTGSGGYQDILINGGTVNCRYEHSVGANYDAASCTLVYYLNAGDYAICNSSATVWWSDNSYFCGYLLG